MQAWEMRWANQFGKNEYEKLPLKENFPSGKVEGSITPEALEGLDVEHLPVTVITAGRASDVRRHFAAALRAALEDRCTPTVCTTAHFLTAFGLAALWYGHGLVFG
jgi:hypothetical protein